MNRIQNAMTDVLKKRAALPTALWNVGMFFLFLVLWQGTGRPLPAAGLGLGLAALGTPVIRAVSTSPRRRDRKLAALLGDSLQWDAFCSSVRQEMQAPLAAEFHAREYRLSLFVTRTWLILLSVNGSLICRRDQITSVEADFDEVHSRHAVRISMRDEPDFLCSCEHSYQELIPIIEKTKEGEKR